MKKRKVILIGGGGHCHSVIDVVETEDKYQIIGILDQNKKIGAKILGYKVIGTDSDIIEWHKKEVGFIITLGQIKTAERRISIYEKLESINADIVISISPTAHVSKHAKIGKGSVIMHHAIINSKVKIGCNSIINTKALIEHDSIIGNNCHISTAAVVNGSCKINNGCFVGSNSVLFENITIGENCIIGAGSVVTKSFKNDNEIFGNPATIKSSKKCQKQ
jgi:sugar O-acyltransferase (sialic acid O-acetyltransferase NeuD family)